MNARTTEIGEPIPLVTLALSDGDVDRLWTCVRHCRLSLEKLPEPDEDGVSELLGLERLLERSET